MDLSTHEGDIPIPISTTYVLHDNNNNHHHHHHHSSNGPPPHPLSIENPYKKIGPIVKYRECLKNHAAAIGGNATDGCGEFMPSGQEGTLEALKCSACNCHRNFHRKEAEGEGDYCFHHLANGRKLISGGAHKGVLIPRPTPHSMIMPLGTIQSSESDEMDGMRPGHSAPMAKKRFRTKFSSEQKEKMMEFAERIGWRLQKQEEGMIQQFCQEIGVKRRVLKVWMHNNKHNLAKKAAQPQQSPPPLPPPLPSSLSERMDE